MLTKILLGLAAAVLAIAGIAGASLVSKKTAQPKVICCGECRPGDDCLKKCEVVGDVPKDTKLTCCGHCKKGDNCLEKCGAKKASCCKAK